jgi:hypothetical protein
MMSRSDQPATRLPVDPSRAVVWLALLIALLALLGSGLGLFWQGEGGPFAFTTLHGQVVWINGQGVYRYDTFFKAPILRGADAVTLFVAIPLLLFALRRYRRGSPRGALVLAGALAYFLYNSASLALGAAYNNLFLVYLACFSASLFALARAAVSIDLQTLSATISPRLPRRALAAFMFVAGSSVFVWLVEIVGALARGAVPPGLASYTTDVTAVLDLGVIAPAAFLAGVLLLRRAPLGYLLAASLMILNALIGLVVVAQTVMQSLAGITLSAGQYVGYVGTFVVMGLVACWLTVVLLRGITEATPPRMASAAPLAGPGELR